MLETTKSCNVYHNPGEFGGEVSITGRKTSFSAFMRTRKLSAALARASINGTVRTTPPSSSSSEESRKTSSESQSTDNSVPEDEISMTRFDDEDDDQFLKPRPLYQRRMSVPEKVFMSANYAILRPSMDEEVRFEVVAAFDRHTDPYRRYMQSLSCYDLAPTHSAIVMMDGGLKVHKALTALSQSGHNAAIVTNMERGNTVLTVSDCLRAIIMAAGGESRVAEETLEEFMTAQHRKKWITANVNTSVWDAARLLTINRVHRLPILQCELGDVFAGSRADDVLYILTLRNIFVETVLKLSDPKLELGPHVKQRSLLESKTGTWRDIVTVTETSTIKETIALFFEKKISCVPVLDDKRRVVGLLSKGDIMAELVLHPTNYLEVLDLPVTKAMWHVPHSALGSPNQSIWDSISTLAASDRPSLCIVDVERRPVAIVSYSDLMDYIQNSAEVHHKMSVA